MHFDLTDLRLFVHVAEAGSITAGAARSGLALPSASSRIKGMETQAGIALLERGRRGVALTVAGQVLLDHARLVTHQIERMKGDVGQYAHGLRRRVRLASNTAATAEHLPGCLARFLRAHPTTDVDLMERASDEVPLAVAIGEADVGIAVDVTNLLGLEVRPFRSDRLALVTSPDHPLATRPDARFIDALQFDFIGLTGDTALGRHLAEQAARVRRPMRTRVEVRSLDVACRIAASGAAVTIVPEVTGKRWQDAGGVKVVALSDDWATRRLVVVSRCAEELGLQSRLLIETLTLP